MPYIVLGCVPGAHITGLGQRGSSNLKLNTSPLQGANEKMGLLICNIYVIKLATLILYFQMCVNYLLFSQVKA